MRTKEDEGGRRRKEEEGRGRKRKEEEERGRKRKKERKKNKRKEPCTECPGCLGDPCACGMTGTDAGAAWMTERKIVSEKFGEHLLPLSLYQANCDMVPEVNGTHELFTPETLCCQVLHRGKEMTEGQKLLANEQMDCSRAGLAQASPLVPMAVVASMATMASSHTKSN